MLATRIKQRPIALVAWLVSILLSIAIVFSFWKSVTVFSPLNIIFGTGSIWVSRNTAADFDWATDYAWFVDDMPSFPSRSIWGNLRLLFVLDPPQLNPMFSQIPLTIPTTLLFAFSSWRFWRRLSYPIGHCQSCGYNLQSNESGKCPECGDSTRPEAAKPE